MAEIIDFIIELIYSITGGIFCYEKKFQSASYVPIEDRDVLLARLQAHLSKDPATASFKYSYVYIDRSIRGMKIVLLDDDYRKVQSVMFSDSLNSKWKTGKIEYHHE